MKDIPGSLTVRSATGRGSAEVNVFFTWSVDMVQSELYVLSRLSQIRGTLPATATTSVFRLTFSAFPIIGVSLTSPTRDVTELWETARYNLKPRFLRIPGVARVDLVGGRTPEFHVVVDPLRLQAAGLGLAQVTDALAQNNLIAPAGMHEENHTLYLAVVDGRVHDVDEIEESGRGGARRASRCGSAISPASSADPSRSSTSSPPTASTRCCSTSAASPTAARSTSPATCGPRSQAVKRDLPPDMKLAFFYDQSLLVRESVRSVWEAIVFGLILSVVIIYLFLRNWGTTLVATLVIPVTVLVTLVAMKLAGLSFNLMTLGGIAAAIGLVIDDAIVVVEAIHAQARRRPRREPRRYRRPWARSSGRSSARR